MLNVFIMRDLSATVAEPVEVTTASERPADLLYFIDYCLKNAIFVKMRDPVTFLNSGFC